MGVLVPFPGLKWVRLERGKPGEFMMLGINENSKRIVMDFTPDREYVGRDIVFILADLMVRQGWKEIERRNMHES